MFTGKFIYGALTMMLIWFAVEAATTIYSNISTSNRVMYRMYLVSNNTKIYGTVAYHSFCTLTVHA